MVKSRTSCQGQNEVEGNQSTMTARHSLWEHSLHLESQKNQLHILLMKSLRSYSLHTVLSDEITEH